MENQEKIGAEPKHAWRRADMPTRMTGSTYSLSYVRCPFYRVDDGIKRIACEGFTDDSSVTQTYRYKHQFDRQMQIFCCDRFQNCEVYRLLMEKYE